MSVRVLELDQFQLTDSEDDIVWSVSPSIHAKIPESVFHNSNQEIIAALTSGNIWPSRGAHFSLDFYIMTDHLHDPQQKLQMCESLAYLIQDAYLWTQLSLSASNTITKSADSSEPRPDFSLRLVQKIPELGPMVQQKVWLSGLIDVRPPSSVACTTIQKIEIRLKVNRVTRKPDHPTKRVKFDAKRNEEEKFVLPDQKCATHNIPHMEMFEGVVKRLSRTLSKSISKCFSHSEIEETGHDRVRLDEKSATVIISSNRGSVVDETEEMLLPASHLSDSAVGAVERADEEMLLSHCHRGFVSDIAEDDRQMLFSQKLGPSPPLYANLLDLADSISTLGSSLKRSIASQSTLDASSQTGGDYHSGLSIRGSHKLMEATTRAMFDGCISGNRRSLHNIQMDEPYPVTSISRLVPGMFNPGFSEASASNSFFLPTISHAISTSLPSYIQSPMLRRKLAKLGSVFMIGEENVHPATSATDRLSKVVQTKLWSMMKRQLYNPAATKSLRWRKEEKESEDKNDGTEQQMLFYHSPLEDADADDGTHTDLLGYGGDGDDDVASEFDDLLEDDGGQTLDYWEQQRIETERQTDEMLFGGYDWNYEDHGPDPNEDIILLDGTNREECMLV